MNGDLYQIHGPMRGQDGNPVWIIVRPLEGCRRYISLCECLSQASAERECAALNAAAVKASALTEAA